MADSTAFSKLSKELNLQDLSGSSLPAEDGAFYFSEDSFYGNSGALFKGVVSGSSLAVASGSTITAILDEDGMGTNSATALATQQSIKAYVDAQVTAQDLDATTDSGTIAIDLDSETLTIAGGTGLDTAGSGTTITVNISDSGVNTTQLADNAVTTAKITDANVTNAKLANDSVIVGTTEIDLGASSTSLAGLTGLDFADDNASIAASIGGNTLTLGGGSSTVAIAGNLSVAGTTTTVSSTVVSVADTVMVFASGSNNSAVATAGGAGFAVGGDGADALASFKYDGADSFDVTDHINLASSQEYKINNTSVLSATTLGDAVRSSSLTSVGTIGTGVWQGTAIATAYIADDAITGAKIADDAVNSEHIALGALDQEHYSSGSIENGHLANSTVSFGGVSLALGASDGTPAFDLSDATSYPGDSALVTAGALNAGSITSGFGDINIGSSTLNAGATALGGNLQVTGTMNSTGMATMAAVASAGVGGFGGKVTVTSGGLEVTGNVVFNSADLTLDDGQQVKAGSFVTYSDRELKQNIVSIDDSLDKIMKLDAVSYDMKSSGRQEIGFIAQEVAKVVPEICALDNNGVGRGIDYGRLTSLLAGAVKTQQNQIAELKAAIAKLDK